MFEKQCKSRMDKFKAPSDVTNGTPDYPAKAESLTLQDFRYPKWAGMGSGKKDPKKPTDETRRTRQTPTIMFEKQCKSGMDKFKAPSDVTNGTPDYPAKAESLTLQVNPNEPGL
ncbi:hypothetical protein CTI12_AA238760 [Artemisia annua]|uniref:Uncharacterized protein n=1 Tax=Artemisia annua TaxID=35608 RepID=A0A2U1NPG6_ARTAN|nr:hypothetical protein CTI12_AA238760 [Artemisia annua]